MYLLKKLSEIFSYTGLITNFLAYPVSHKE
jgi:hypothetical protein